MIKLEYTCTGKSEVMVPNGEDSTVSVTVSLMPVHTTVGYGKGAVIGTPNTTKARKSENAENVKVSSGAVTLTSTGNNLEEFVIGETYVISISK